VKLGMVSPEFPQGMGKAKKDLTPLFTFNHMALWCALRFLAHTLAACRGLPLSPLTSFLALAIASPGGFPPVPAGPALPAVRTAGPSVAPGIRPPAVPA
jgi:hypothetical protein